MYERRGGGGSGAIRIVIALAIAGVSTCTYLSQRTTNPVTGQVQSVAMTPKQEIALGLQSAPEMERQFGGEDPDQKAQRIVEGIGERVVRGSDAARSEYRFDFHLLADGRTVNAFALPGGQIFITRALYDKLGTEDMLAGVLGHEIGHVVGRHSAAQMAKQQRNQGLAAAAGVATTDPNNPRSYGNAAIAQAVVGLVNLKYGRDDEDQADALGVRYMAQAGYNPNAMVKVMDVLESVSGGGNAPEWTQTHPNPGHRREKIKAEIAKMGGR